MQERNLTLVETLTYANEAIKHARDQIRKGSTQLENNNLKETYFEYLHRGIKGKADSGEIGIREVTHQQVADRLEVSPYKDRRLAHYESIISTTSKYSLGNCFELAVQALNFILQNAPLHLNAEVYEIQNGDHVILVLNRDQNSNPQDPATWGKNAVICDPWSNKSYKASEYLVHLKNFYRKDNKNHVEPYNPKKHVLIPSANFNSNLLRYTKNVDNLRANFFNEANALNKMLDDYKDLLMKEEQRLKIKYGVNDKKVAIIQRKIDDIELTIRYINGGTLYYLEKNFKNDYVSTKDKLAEELADFTKKAFSSIQFSNSDKLDLFKHRGEDIKTEFMKIFSIRSETQSTLDDFIKDADDKFTKKHK